MPRYGYTMMCEQSGPEDSGLDEMGHSLYARFVLGAAAPAMTSIDLMS